MSQSTTPISINYYYDKIVNSINNNSPNSNSIPTCFQYFDKDFGGLNPGELVVVGGRPGMGKTQFAVNMVLNMSQTSPVLYFSFDLTPFVLSARMISCKTSIPVYKILDNDLTADEKDKIKAISDDLKQAKIYLDDSAIGDVDRMLTIIEQHVKEYGVKVVVIDYLQLITNGYNYRRRDAEIDFICRSLKKCAKSLKISIVALSQLSRSVETRGSSKRPILSDLRDSGAIEEIADKVWFLYRPEFYLIDEFDDEFRSPTVNIIELNIVKNKTGKTGVSYFERDVDFTRIKSIISPAALNGLIEERLSELENPSIEKVKDIDEFDVPF